MTADFREMARAAGQVSMASCLLLIGCASQAASSVDAISPPLESYKALLDEAQRFSNANDFLNNSIWMDDETRKLMLDGLDDPYLKSLLSECGLIDVISCFATPPAAVTKLRVLSEEKLQLSCIRFSGKSKNGDLLVADVYLSHAAESNRWKFVSSSKHYFETPDQITAVGSCWADGQT